MQFPTERYNCIVADPPWQQPMLGKWKRPQAKNIKERLVYRTMPLKEIIELPVRDLAQPGAHLWLWTTNAFLRQSFDVMEAWGFSYLSVITWVKPSGVGAWFVSTTQHCLFGYFKSCKFPLARYKPTHFLANVSRQHSAKPEQFYDLVRSISPGPRLDMFNRRLIEGFTGWGDQTPEIPKAEVLEAREV